MGSLDEKRVYDEKAGKREVLVASAAGVVAIVVSGDLVGGFGVEHRCNARDLAATDGRTAVATDEDVLVGFEPTGHGPAVAVGFRGGVLHAAAPDGTVSRFDAPDGRTAPGSASGDASPDADTDTHADAWTPVGDASAVRAIDGSLVAAADGVYRIEDGGLSPAGLDDVRDVSAVGGPLAAAGSGLYGLGNGWLDLLDGSFDVAVGAPGGRAYAVGEAGAVARRDGDWAPLNLPTEEPIADFGAAPGTAFAVTTEGTFLLSVGDGWRSQVLGLRDVGALAVRS